MSRILVLSESVRSENSTMAESGMTLWAAAATMILIWFAIPSQAIWLSLPSSGTKCISEEIHSNVVVLLDYSLVQGGDDDRSHPITMSVRVTSPYGTNLHHQDNVTKGQSAFTTGDAGNHIACFWLDGNQQEGADRSIDVDWKIGITAKDWDSVAKKEKIEGVELELRRLEGIVDAIHQNIIFLKEREAKMREVSETTNARVAWFSLMALGICIVVSALQLWYLKRFFRKKKLI